LLQHNAPAQGRWYSRDVAAIARTQGLHDVAPYFVDADAASPSATGPASAPVGGLTVIAFHNSHLLYAIIWFSLSAMVAWGAWMVARDEMILRRC
jgi:surfeit locus 1 family protein